MYEIVLSSNTKIDAWASLELMRGQYPTYVTLLLPKGLWGKVSENMVLTSILAFSKLIDLQGLPF